MQFTERNKLQGLVTEPQNIKAKMMLHVNSEFSSME